MLASFDRAGTSNGPSETIDGRLEHLRGSALAFRNLIYDSTGAYTGPRIQADYTPAC